jgi:hypothetical protein
MNNQGLTIHLDIILDIIFKLVLLFSIIGISNDLESIEKNIKKLNDYNEVIRDVAVNSVGNKT